jgi:hypothetical protein
VESNACFLSFLVRSIVNSKRNASRWEIPTRENTPMSKLDVSGKDSPRLDEDELTPDLVRLDASSNRLTSPLPALGHLVDLRWLNLSKNRLTSLDSVGSLPSLQVLNVSHNELTGKLSVGRLRGLTALVVNANQITSLGGLEKLTKLETLIVSNNRIAELSGWISQATSLTKLSASNNPVTTFSGLRSLHAMKELRLNSTGLHEVGDIVGGMPKLRILEVGGGNGIRRFEELGELPRGLWQLNLKGTPLASTSGYEEEIVKRYPHLDVIDGRRRREKGKVERVRARGRGDADGMKVNQGGGQTSERKKDRNDENDGGEDGGGEDGGDADEVDDALDPGAFKVGRVETKADRPAKVLGGPKMKDNRRDRETGGSEGRAGPKKKKRKETKEKEKRKEKRKENEKQMRKGVGAIARVLHAAKDDQLSAW